eukprot:SAG31_NODE_346_length_17349_cov_9.825875_14_plen_110_part_00
MVLPQVQLYRIKCLHTCIDVSVVMNTFCDSLADNITADGWLDTGDIARLDSEGYLYIMDRAKDLIIRGGENISCAEVESAVYDHPAVREAAAFGPLLAFHTSRQHACFC